MPTHNNELRHQRNLHDTLLQVNHLLEKQKLVNALVRKQDTPRHELVQSLVAKQHLVELKHKLEQLHPADLAFVLESLPLDDRLKVWELIPVEKYGAILLESAEAVRDSLIANMERHQIIHVAEHLDSDEIADLMPALPKDTVFEILTQLDSQNREQVQSVMRFPEGTAGALMDFDMITVREDVNLDTVLRYLRRLGKIPHQTDQLFVVDRNSIIKGVLPLTELLIHAPDDSVHDVMRNEFISFYTDDSAHEISQAFERYDLISAPVINSHNQLVGCLGVDVVVDFIDATLQRERLNQAGLEEEEDLFAPVWKSGRNRWAWLALNLMTAFIASRIIGMFEDTIEKLVALATLMPIVASIGGNTGNQTVALVIRGLALKKINADNFLHFFFKEITISLMNGILWGSVVGVFALLLYQDIRLALVMMAAMILNLLIAALAGVFIPVGLSKCGRDPVMGSSVMLTALTDSMGFFIFLGLATIFLLPH
ncbi:magnesium transporter [Beggiatoa leptomitoformis]|uniref:Magnesium transporter MgtE n=1 Tax=Beggiatoa leptomitoformis TaxID=288004 RepID=A0A2N9YER1_9GAMM|nr:magnesium transporter [Beggiatoa leptomitoformis]ALG68693.1 magnesium transporter [Beggiatoa leptomitoformis]AUI68954.1 magnesium transporter [Beggiatoa leptomitoformis]